MTPQRLRQVELGADLSKEEVAAGWHFCNEWDGMCAHPNSPEAEACGCPMRPMKDSPPGQADEPK